LTNAFAGGKVPSRSRGRTAMLHRLISPEDAALVISEIVAIGLFAATSVCIVALCIGLS